MLGQRIWREPAIWVVSGAGALAAARAWLVTWRDEGDSGWWWFILALVIAVFAIFEISWSRRRFLALCPVIERTIDHPRPEVVRRWYRSSVRRMYDFRSSALAATAFMPLVAWGLWYTDWCGWIPDPLVRGYDLGVTLLALTVAASSQWPFSNITVFIARLPRKPLRVNLFHHRTDSIMSVGAFLMKIDLGGLLLVSLATGGILIAPIKVSPIIYILLILVLLWALVWFFATQYQIYEVMRSEKRERLSRLASLMSSSLDRIGGQQNVQGELEQYQAMKAVYEHIAGLPEWPFRPRNVVGLTSGILVPLVLAVLDFLKS